MNTRSLQEHDIAQIARWNVQLHEDEGSAPMSIDAAAERIRRWLADRRFEGAIFLVDDNPTGYVLYQHRPVHVDLRASESVYIRQFFICRESRRRGFGTAAFEAFVRERVPSNANVTLEVKVSNPAGQRFWEAMEFAPKSVEYELDRRIVT